MISIQKKLENFLQKKEKRNKLIVIYGPTASGKTALSIDIAKKLETEIISTDSRQIFKYMDIGTAKITNEEMSGIKHHMIDIVNPNENYSVGEFKNATLLILDKLFSKGKIPILCGGTGLYIDSIIYDFSIPKVIVNQDYRNFLEKEALEKGKEYVFELLKKIDPKYANTLHYNNLRYVIRALEIYHETGSLKSDFIEEKKLKYDTFFITPYDGNREALYKRIDYRVLKMIEDGFIDEVKGLLDMGYKESDFGLKTIGYEEIIEFLNGKISKEDFIKLIQKNTRNYAKRQLTWFRKYEKGN